MITGLPSVEEIDGQREVVDESGTILVCRSRGNKLGERNYHRVDPEAWERDRTVQPACAGCWPREGVDWRLRHRSDLEPNWGGCSYAVCFGEYDPHSSPKKSGHNGLAARLESMTVDEFDAEVAQQ